MGYVSRPSRLLLLRSQFRALDTRERHFLPVLAMLRYYFYNFVQARVLVGGGGKTTRWSRGLETFGQDRHSRVRGTVENGNIGVVISSWMAVLKQSLAESKSPVSCRTFPMLNLQVQHKTHGQFISAQSSVTLQTSQHVQVQSLSKVYGPQRV